VPLPGLKSCPPKCPFESVNLLVLLADPRAAPRIAGIPDLMIVRLSAVLGVHPHFSSNDTVEDSPASGLDGDRVPSWDVLSHIPWQQAMRHVLCSLAEFVTAGG